MSEERWSKNIPHWSPREKRGRGEEDDPSPPSKKCKTYITNAMEKKDLKGETEKIEENIEKKFTLFKDIA